MKIHLLLFFVLFLSILHKSMYASDSKPASQEAVDAILSAPDWTQMDESRLMDEGNVLIDTLKSHLELPADAARHVIEMLKASSKSPIDTSIDGRIYLFNRIYCNVPVWESKPQVRYFGGWIGVPEEAAQINVLFPLGMKDNNLFIKHVFGGYSGAPYDGLAEFDYFYKHYGIRHQKP